MKILLAIAIILHSFSLFCQKQVEKRVRLMLVDVESRQLINLEVDSSKIFYRVWLEPDLVIEIDDKIVLTLSMREFDRTNKSFMVLNVKKYTSNIPASRIINYLDSISLINWKDVESTKSLSAVGAISDRKRIVIEYSDMKRYKAFWFYGPASDQQSDLRERVLGLINFLDKSINPDEFRLEYYRELSKSNNTAKQRIKEIEEYRDYYREQIEKGVLPRMWGDF